VNISSGAKKNHPMCKVTKRKNKRKKAKKGGARHTLFLGFPMRYMGAFPFSKKSEQGRKKGALFRKALRRRREIAVFLFKTPKTQYIAFTS